MDLKLSMNYLLEVMDYSSSSLVGRILKRFEIIDDQKLLKASIKELVYEEMRHVRDLLIAGGHGLEQTVFSFKKGDKSIKEKE